MSKRTFDVLIVLLSTPVWIPMFLLVTVMLAVFSGFPVFYRSQRRVFERESVPVLKFRTMVRNAAVVYNRDTVPVTGQRFLNTPIDSPLYTRIGRFVERCQFTELPQIFNVLSGKMSVVGNRPLPENVIASLKEVYLATDDRFASRCGLTGLVQLIGRDELADEDRLDLEIHYAKWANEHYSAILDLLILVSTVLIHSRLMRPLSLEQAHQLINRFSPSGNRLFTGASRRDKEMVVGKAIRAEGDGV